MLTLVQSPIVSLLVLPLALGRPKLAHAFNVLQVLESSTIDRVRSL